MDSLDLKFDLDESGKQYRENLVRRMKEDSLIQQLLARNHLDASILEKNSSEFARWLRQAKNCQGCKGLGFCTQAIRGNVCDIQVDDQGFVNEVYRPCKYLKLENSQMAHKNNFSLSHMQGRDYLISFETLSQTLESESRAYLFAYSKAVSSISLKDGCLFFGQPGTGKSTLMMALANETARTGKKVAFVRVPLLISELKENLNDDEFRAKTLGRMRFADVLFLDDFGSEAATPWTRDEILFPILDERMNNRKKTYFASNITLQELEHRYALDNSTTDSVAAMRLMDRVRALAKPVELFGHSRRHSPE